MKTVSKAVDYLRMIKFSHTIFALPFALASVVLVSRNEALSMNKLLWIIVAMAGARSFAMGFNRLADASIDARNQRTAMREIPRGIISRKEAGFFVMVSGAVFVFSAFMLSGLCFILAFPVLGLLSLYSYTKRFTWLAHIILGFAIGLAPMAVWVALTGSLSWKIGMLSAALLAYIAGFDILYACQDADFDTAEGLYSIPCVFGIKRALIISRIMHCISIGALICLYRLFELSPVYLVFTGIIAVLFVIEHSLVNPDDLSRINLAFFHVNSVISVMVFAAVLSGEMLRGVL